MTRSSYCEKRKNGHENHLVPGFEKSIVINKSYTKTIILATGFGTIRISKLDLDNAAKYEGKYLFDTVENFNHFQDRLVLIFCGGNTAVTNSKLQHLRKSEITH